MNYSQVIRIMGWILLVISALLVLPLAVALIYRESILPFLYTILISASLGGLTILLIKPKKKIFYAREGFLTVALTWIVVSLVGCLPFIFSGAIPRFADAFFETVSGFTTTGSTILTNVEALPRGILFWRSFTHWIGGMGVIVFIMAILPSLGAGSVHIMKAEVTGTSFGKVAPKLKVTAKWLYYLYIALTLIMLILLLAGGMNLYDSLVHTFGTAGTGGFSVYNASIGHYQNLYFEIVITVFMILFGVNFNIFFFILLWDWKSVWKSDEMWTYFATIAISILLIAWNITSMYNNFATALRHSSFHVASIISTTGFATVNFCEWPMFSQSILLILTCVGACCGSTGGGLKITRMLLLGKILYRDLCRMVRPRSIKAIRLNGKAVEEDSIRDLSAYLIAYVGIISVATLLITLDCSDFTTAFTAMLTCFNNIGPGLGAVGPVGNFAFFADGTKYLLSFLMLLGRLEIFPLLLAVTPILYKNK